VSKKNQKLHDLVELGLHRAIEDGSFDRLFDQYFSDVITQSNLHKRKIFKIPNLNMTPSTPLGKPELWYSIKGTP
jgi:hypothetical protein